MNMHGCLQSQLQSIFVQSKVVMTFGGHQKAALTLHSHRLCQVGVEIERASVGSDVAVLQVACTSPNPNLG